MMLAIGRLTDVADSTRLGTVFAVSRRLALTAFHCVGDRETGYVRYHRLRCNWNQYASKAELLDGDKLNDVALLRLEHPLPGELTPVKLERNVIPHTQFVAPGDPTAIARIEGFAVSGRITWTGTLLETGAPVIQLECRQSAAGLPLSGFSGAPVLVGESHTAVGIIRWNLPREDHPELAVGGAVFAAPSTAILERWPHLDPSTVDTEHAINTLLQRIVRPGSRHEVPKIATDIKSFLQQADLGIDEREVELISTNRFNGINISKANVVIEIEHSIQTNAHAKRAEKHLLEHLTARNNQADSRYIGVLTDGKEWRLYRIRSSGLQQIEQAKLTLDSTAPDLHAILSWLEAILATRQQTKPTPIEIASKLGARSPSYALHFAELKELYETCAKIPTVRVKREMWAKLLTTASGTNFTDNDSLFIDHTLLVATAKVIGHAVLGFFRPEYSSITATEIMLGTKFSEAGIGGVIESDFFDWIVDDSVPGGRPFIDDLVRRLTRFAWDQVQHDVMKVIYESIIPEDTRHSLGEYYTPDWLAEYIIEECITSPLTQRVLDASCGSGTFLFHAIRRHIAAAEDAGNPTPEVIRELANHVVGFDVQPVAVMLARVTYLLAIGMSRLQGERRGFTVPVYLCDSLRWGQESTLWSYKGLSIPTTLDHAALLYDEEYEDHQDFSDRLKFPDSVIANTTRFDELVSELAEKACDRNSGDPPPSLVGVFKRFGIRGRDAATLKRTFENMCDLHDQKMDHIWGYYVRNLARPVWLARPDNRVDVLVGNPPWLTYRYMTEIQKSSFRAMTKERGLWAGGHSVTGQDLSALFVVRCIELYLQPDGEFGFVMPLAALTRKPYSGFRKGSYSLQTEPLKVAFDRPWDLRRVKPRFFRQAVGVILGRRLPETRKAIPLDGLTRRAWSGSFDTKRATRDEVDAVISIGDEKSIPLAPSGSPYAERFSAGATVFPRFLFIVNCRDNISPIGMDSTRVSVRSQRSAIEKKPWKHLDAKEGSVEKKFIFPLALGNSVLPFRLLTPMAAVLPWDNENQRLLHTDGGGLDEYQHLSNWWRSAEATWRQYRSSDRLDLIDRLDYHRGLSKQFPIAKHRVVYSASGMYLAAAVISDASIVVEHKLYWAPTSSLEEARFLASILNSSALTLAVRHLQAWGEHNPRDFDKYVFQLPIPLFDPDNPVHQLLVSCSKRAEEIADRTTLPDKRFEVQRRCIRDALVADGVAAKIDSAVMTILKTRDSRS